jgi:hypothetical protein
MVTRFICSRLRYVVILVLIIIQLDVKYPDIIFPLRNQMDGVKSPLAGFYESKRRAEGLCVPIR